MALHPRTRRLVLVTALTLGAATVTVPADAAAPRPFDLQAHRGGIGLTTESSLEGFTKALRLGVSTLELDTQVTRDEKVVVTGMRMIELGDVFGLVRRHRAWGVKLNIETKVEAGAPEQTAPRKLFVRRVFEEIRASGLEHQVTVQSFDWGALRQMHQLAPRWPLVALTNYDFLQVGKPGASPWLGGIDADDFGGDFVRAADAVPGVKTLSPVYGFPQNGTIADPAFRFHVERSMVRRAHARGLKVVPWPANDPATIEALMDLGIDGIITDYPDRVRELMAERGLRLPQQYR